MLPTNLTVSEWQCKTLTKILGGIVEVVTDEEGNETLVAKEGAKAFLDSIGFKADGDGENDLTRSNRLLKKVSVINADYKALKDAIRLTEDEKILIAGCLKDANPKALVSIALDGYEDIVRTADFFGNVREVVNHKLVISPYYKKSSGYEHDAIVVDAGENVVLEGIQKGYFYKPKEDLGITLVYPEGEDEGVTPFGDAEVE